MRMQMALAWNANYFTACQLEIQPEDAKDNCHDDDDGAWEWKMVGDGKWEMALGMGK